MNANDPNGASSTDIETWLSEFFATIDRMDAGDFAAFFDPDGQFRFANSPPAAGREAIAGGAGWIFGLLERIEHERLRTWITDPAVIVEGMVHYVRKEDQRRLSFPFMSVFEFAQGRVRAISSYRVYVDSHELFQ